MIPLEVVTVALEALRPHPENPNNGDVDAIAKSLAAHGQIIPLVASVDGYLLKGNSTYAAMHQLGWREAAVTFRPYGGFTTAALRLLVDDNHTSDLRVYDDALLLQVIERIEAADELDRTVFEPDDVQAMRDALRRAEHTPLNGTPTPAAPDPLPERLERAEVARRYLALEYTPAEFTEVQARLEYIRDETGLETNAEAVLHLIRRGTPNRFTL